MSKSKIYEALLVISTAFLVIYLYGIIKYGESKEVFIYLACGIGLSGIFLRPLGRLIARGWYKLAELLSYVMSKVIMAAVYILVLVPVATLYRLTKKDKLGLWKGPETKWINRDHKYTAGDLKNIW
jgi:hypothetical protein